MALMKCSAIHDRPKATIAYIMNLEKTKNGRLITGINVVKDAALADKKMKFYREKFKSSNKVKAMHIIHSFSDKENISPELANEISLEWYKRVFPREALAISATHIRRENMLGEKCIHTHLLINNVCRDGTRIRTDKEFIEKALEISNEICKEYGLKHSFIKNERKIPSKSWYEYQQERVGDSWKEKIREDIDRIIPSAKNIEHLYSLLKDEGYELKTDRKYVAIRPPGKERFVRLKTLGFNYSAEQIENRILGLSEHNLDGISHRTYKNNKWIDKDVYKYKFKKGSVGTIIQLTAKIIATQLDIYSTNKKYTRHNFKAEKELMAMEKALIFIQNNSFETREDLVRAYNNLETELEKISKWKSKAQKAIDAVNSISNEITKLQKGVELVNIKEQEHLTTQQKLKDTMTIYDKCRHREYDSLYKEKDKEKDEPSR